MSYLESKPECSPHSCEQMLHVRMELPERVNGAAGRIAYPHMSYDIAWVGRLLAKGCDGFLRAGRQIQPAIDRFIYEPFDVVSEPVRFLEILLGKSSSN